jgi:Dullard-like phosphatase family protein
MGLKVAISAYSNCTDVKTDLIVSFTQSVFKDEKARREVSYSATLELVAVSVLAGALSTSPSLGAAVAPIRNLFFYVHQNFLYLCELVLSRVVLDLTQSVWAFALKSAIEHKKVRRQARGDISLWIFEHCEIISAALRQIVAYKSLLPTHIHRVIFRILSNSRGFPYAKSREMLEKVLSETYFLGENGNSERKYTLVLDLDETLVHYVDSNAGDSRVLVRPGCDSFLKRMSAEYEIVIFTAAQQDYADWVINQLDQGSWVSARLYRQHTVASGSFFLKDLSKLGRDLSKVIIIDNVAENFSLQPENGIVIRSWYDDESDEALSQLEPLLLGTCYIEISRRKVPDVRIALKQFREQMLQRIAEGDPTPHLNLHILN